MTTLGGELDGKRLELIRELVPTAERISVLAYAGSPRSIPRITGIEALANPLGIRVTARPIKEAGEFDGAFAATAADHDQAMLVQQSPLMEGTSPELSPLQLNTTSRRSMSFGGPLKSAV
jgi:putative tryptophan/tyrosine transport system substrate-binding protein